MALKKAFITGVEGATSISHPELFGATIYGCFREAQPLFETDGDPVGNRFKHVGTEIRLDTNIPIIKSIKREVFDTYKPEQFTVIYRN